MEIVFEDSNSFDAAKLLRVNCKKCPMRRTSAIQSLRDMENMEIVPIVVRHWMTIMLEEMDFV